MPAATNIEDLLKNFLDGGWETLSAATDRSDDERRRRESRQAAISADVLTVAKTPAGRAMLEFIFDNSVRRASWHGDLRVPLEQVASYGLLREGQNSIAAMLLSALRHATGGDISFLNTNGETDARSRKWFVRASWWRKARRWWSR